MIMLALKGFMPDAQELRRALAEVTAPVQELSDLSDTVPAWTHLSDRLTAGVSAIAEQPEGPVGSAQAESEGLLDDGTDQAILLLNSQRAQHTTASAVVAGAQGIVEQLLLWSQAMKAERAGWQGSTGTTDGDTPRLSDCLTSIDPKIRGPFNPSHLLYLAYCLVQHDFDIHIGRNWCKHSHTPVHSIIPFQLWLQSVR